MVRFILWVIATITLSLLYLHYSTFNWISPWDNVVCTKTLRWYVSLWGGDIIWEVIYIQQGIKRTKRNHYGTGYILLHWNVHIHWYEIWSDVWSHNYYAIPKLCKKLTEETYQLLLKEKWLVI